MKKTINNHYLPLFWCLFTIINSIIWFFTEICIGDFNLMFLFGFNTVLNSLEMFIGGTLFGDGILAYFSIPYLALLIAFLVSVLLAILLLLIRKSNKLFSALLIADCIISALTIVIVCVYNVKDAFIWDKACGIILNLLLFIFVKRENSSNPLND